MREALQRLEAEKLVTIIPNKGPSVAAITWEEAAQIYDVRALLEGEAAALFAARVTDEEVSAMRAALDSFERAVVEGNAAGRLELSLLSSLSAASRQASINSTELSAPERIPSLASRMVEERAPFMLLAERLSWAQRR